MPGVLVTVEQNDIDKVVSLVAGIRDGVPKVLRGALYDATKKTKTKLSAGIRDRVNIKKEDLDPYLKVTYPTPGHLESRIILEEEHRPGLIRFNARQPKRGKGVTYQISKTEGRKEIKGAFLVTVRKATAEREGDQQVFKRKGKKRLPIIKLKGISAWGTFVKSGLEPEILKTTTEDLHEAIEHRVLLELQRATGEVKT